MTQEQLITWGLGLSLNLLIAWYTIDRNKKQDSAKALSEMNERVSQLERTSTRLETQMEPFWRIIEDSVLKSVTHNPLTAEERALLSKYHRYRLHPDLSKFMTLEELVAAKQGLQRELKAIEDNPSLEAESSLPYILMIAAIDRRLVRDYNWAN